MASARDSRRGAVQLRGISVLAARQGPVVQSGIRNVIVQTCGATWTCTSRVPLRQGGNLGNGVKGAHLARDVTRPQKAACSKEVSLIVSSGQATAMNGDDAKVMSLFA